MNYIANEYELNRIEEILKIYPSSYTIIRMTDTMLKKAIIDASQPVREILHEGNILNFKEINQGPEYKVMQKGIWIGKEIFEIDVSLYRPNTKQGDPRFWIYGLNKLVNPSDLLYITVYDEQLVFISLKKDDFDLELIKNHLHINQNDLIKSEIIDLLSQVKSRGFIESVSPEKSNPKDVGDTFEMAVGIDPNSDIKADYKGSIELKTKRSSGKTKDTLFSMVPDWSSSLVKSSSEMIRSFGYESTRHSGFMDLYVTVSNKPNRQGLYLQVDDENEKLYQRFVNEKGEDIVLCVWNFADIKRRLEGKHPSTLWIIADEEKINGKYHFHFNKAVLTHTPIFSSFLLLISQGILTYDWRGRVKPDGTGYKDKGHCFRIQPKYRDLLFASSEIIE